MCNFKVGQKVVCIDDSPGIATGLKLLILNEMYTILSIEDTNNNVPGLVVDKVIYPKDRNIAFATYRFRALVHDFADEVEQMIKKENCQLTICT